MCLVAECDDSTHYSKGYCRYHYERQRKGLSLPGPRRTWNHGGRVCAFDPCGQQAKARGYCELHYKRSLKGLPMDMPRWQATRYSCVYVECSSSAGRSMLCPTHLKRVSARKHGVARRALKREAFVEHVDLEVLRAQGNGCCGICDQEVNADLQWPDPASSSIDHIVPLARGGKHSYANTQLAHLHCNVKKHARVAA